MTKPICYTCADDADEREAMLKAIEMAIEELDSSAVMSAMAGVWQYRINKAIYILRKAAKDARE